MKWTVKIMQKGYKETSYEFGSLMEAAKFANIALAPALMAEADSKVEITCEHFDEGIELVDIDEIEEGEE